MPRLARLLHGVPQSGSEGERQASSGAVSCNEDARWVDRELAHQVAEGRSGVVERRRERVLGRQTVIECQHGTIGIERNVADDAAMRTRRAHVVAAAVEVQHDGHVAVAADVLLDLLLRRNVTASALGHAPLGIT